MSKVILSSCMLIFHKDHNNTIQVYSVTVMTHGKALQAGQSSQGTSEPITPAQMVCSSSNRFISNHTDIAIHIVIYSIILH